MSGSTTAAVSAYIGLGSNLEDPRAQVEQAFAELAGLPHTRLIATSPLYQSVAVGPGDQPNYINAVAHITTTLEPLHCLINCKRWNTSISVYALNTGDHAHLISTCCSTQMLSLISRAYRCPILI